jgi:hypothetical protein
MFIMYFNNIFSHQHVSAANAAIFSVKLLQEYKGKIS